MDEWLAYLADNWIASELFGMAVISLPVLIAMLWALLAKIIRPG